MTEQTTIQNWFNETYRTEGLAYLRPAEAYPVYLDILQARPGGALLDIACGPGLLLQGAVRYGLDAHGIDLSEVAVGMAPEIAPGASVQVANVEAIPYPDDRFDYITCIGAVERFLDPGGAMREVQRVAAPGARLCVMVRNSRTFGWRLGAEMLGLKNPESHQGADTLERWTAFFSGAGFQVDEILPDQWFWQRLRRRTRRMDWEAQRGRIRRIPQPALRYANEFIFVMTNPS